MACRHAQGLESRFRAIAKLLRMNESNCVCVWLLACLVAFFFWCRLCIVYQRVEAMVDEEGGGEIMGDEEGNDGQEEGGEEIVIVVLPVIVRGNAP